MKQEPQLTSFAELNPYPIVEIDSEGQVVYANLATRTQFPDLISLGLRHPLLVGLEGHIANFKPLVQGEITVLNRELAWNQRIYEQQIFGLSSAHIFIFMMDVSERNHLRTTAHNNDKMAALGILSAGIAHEIRNPVTWVLGNLNLLQNTARQIKDLSNDENVRKLSEQMRELLADSVYGMELIRDIADHLKDLAKTKTASAPVDIHKMLNMVLNIAAVQFKDNVGFEKKFAENIPLLLTNSSKLHQVFLNLIINGAQAIPDDRKKHFITVSTVLDNNCLRVDVSDTGKGIAPEVLPRIFDPFFTTKGPEQGTGLGLSICRDIIHGLNGEMTVKSQLGVGTTFSVYLPMSAESTPHALGATAGETVRTDKHILVVDNEPMLLKLFTHILREKYLITTVDSGSKAMELLFESPKKFDVIIADLNMPNLSGADLYRLVADKLPGIEKRFIFVTGGTSISWVQQFLEGLDNPVLEKPFSPDDILKLVAKRLNK